MKIALVVPHIFMQQEILPKVIFSPGELALRLAEGLQHLGHEVTLYTPGPVDTPVRNITADMSFFEAELAARGDTYLDLLKKHPLTFITLARQVQSELVAQAYAAEDTDIVHIYGNEEDIALPFARFSRSPVVLTHHDPFNFYVRYKSSFPKYPQLNWLSLSYAQRRSMPAQTNWLANIYHGLPATIFTPAENPAADYVGFLGRIIHPKGTHLAIAAIQAYNHRNPGRPLTLRIAGKHYADSAKDSYWNEYVVPALKDPHIEYVGHLREDAAKREFLANARALLVPSLFEEPFGMVMIEALACGTPVIGLDSGAIPEVIDSGKTGFVAARQKTDDATVAALSKSLERVDDIDRNQCRQSFEQRFTLERMCREHVAAYEKAIQL